MPAPAFELHNRAGGPIHRLDARLKVVAALLFVIGVTAIQPGWKFPVEGFPLDLTWTLLACAWLLLLIVCAVARLPWKPVLLRVIGMAPFVFVLTLPVPMARGAAGWPIAAVMTAKALTALAAMTMLVLTTPFPHILTALRRLRVPALLTAIPAFMYRYLYVLADELEKMRRAKAARTFRRNRLGDWKVLAHFIAVLFVRAFERAERVHAAMCARGWDGRMRHLDE